MKRIGVKKLISPFISLVFLLTACSTSASPSQISPVTKVTPVETTGPATTSSESAQNQNFNCSAPATATPASTEGPYFKTNSPERASLLEPGIAGMKLTLSGYVLNTDCQPVVGARLDFWQADASGQYDNSGYTLRGHQFSDQDGRYQLETIVPGLYPGRTEHIHVKVNAPNGPGLTTQLFFPGVSQNDQDRIYDPALLLDIQQAGDGLNASFNFIVVSN
jgi:protocatechuate 3,4-dioxygenase beta subunit